MVEIFTNKAKQIDKALEFRLNKINALKEFFIKKICEQ